MTLALAAGLFGLALVDSTSIGTLFIPVWLLLAPGKVRAGRFVVYLGTIVAFYFVVGVILALGAYVVFDQVIAAMSDDNNSPWLRVPQLIVGVALFGWSLHLGSKKHRAKREEGRRGTLGAWRERAMSGAGSAGALAGLAVVAAGIELLSMVPYLAAIGLMTAANLSVLGTGASLALYCVAMVLPAIVLIIARMVAHDRVDPLLQRMNRWVERNGSNALSWFVGALGVYLTLNAAAILFLS